MTTIVVDPGEALLRALSAVGEVVVVDDSADDAVWDTLVALQAAHRSQTGRIVLVLPTVGIAGSADSVDYTTAIEGIRAMAKSAARQWGSDGVGVNMVVAPANLFARDADTAHLSAAAAPGNRELIHSVVETAKFLLRDDLRHLTGETVIVDGGSVMLP